MFRTLFFWGGQVSVDVLDVVWGQLLAAQIRIARWSFRECSQQLQKRSSSIPFFTGSSDSPSRSRSQPSNQPGGPTRKCGLSQPPATEQHPAIPKMWTFATNHPRTATLSFPNVDFCSRLVPKRHNGAQSGDSVGGFGIP